MPEQKQLEVEKPLVVVVPENVKDDLGLVDPTKLSVMEADPELVKRADDYTKKLLSLNPKDFQGREDRLVAVGSAGQNLQVNATSNAMLQEQIKELAHRGADGGEVAHALVNLKIQVEDLDPHKWDFRPGWFSRLAGRTPFAGNALKRYFTKYESAQTVIQAIVDSLEKGRQQLIRDNKTLRAEQVKMRELTLRFEKLVQFLRLVDKQVSDDIAAETEEEKRKFLQEELLVALRQTIIDRQQELAVNQQGILVFEVIMRNNNELIRGVNRANRVTINALRVAVTASFALTHQRIVLDKITALNETTSNLLVKNAELLKTQGVEIHKQATEAMIDMEKLKQAFADIHAAMDDISRFRIEALPRMGHTISELETMTTEAEKKIKRMEEGNQVKPQFAIEFE